MNVFSKTLLSLVAYLMLTLYPSNALADSARSRSLLAGFCGIGLSLASLLYSFSSEDNSVALPIPSSENGSKPNITASPETYFTMLEIRMAALKAQEDLQLWRERVDLPSVPPVSPWGQFRTAHAAWASMAITGIVVVFLGRKYVKFLRKPREIYSNTSEGVLVLGERGRQAPANYLITPEDLFARMNVGPGEEITVHSNFKDGQIRLTFTRNGTVCQHFVFDQTGKAKTELGGDLHFSEESVRLNQELWTALFEFAPKLHGTLFKMGKPNTIPGHILETEDLSFEE